jgi:hypothetical protein
MTIATWPTPDPYPWLTIDEEGKEYRTHPGKIDASDPELSGWSFSPRSAEELRELGYSVGESSLLEVSGDPYPWVTMDDGQEFRTALAHEDGVDENGILWSGWTYAPRSQGELDALGY